MMARQVVQIADIAYTIAAGDPPPRELLPWAILRTRVLDELTLAPPLAPISLTSTLPGATAKVADGGICGLVGRPVDVSAALTRPNAFTARVSAPGYLARDLTPAIDAARRALNAPAGPGDQKLDVLPGDPAPRTQFTPGRGVLLERALPTDAEEFMTVDVRAAPPAPTDVPLSERVVTGGPIGLHVAGVPLTLPDQPLHRDAVLRIRGRVQLKTGPSTIVPAGAAEVGIRGVWWDYPSSVTAAPQAPDLCAVDPTLRQAYATNANVSRCAPTTTGPVRTLRDGAAPESMMVVIAPNDLLNPAGGDLIRIGNPLTSDDELVVTAGFDAVADPTAPVRVVLRTPTGKLHRAGEPVRAMNMGAVTPVGNTTREGLPGDVVVFASGLPALPTSATIVVDDGNPLRATFYRATQFPSTTNGVAFSHVVAPDVTGRFTWPPIARVAQIRVMANMPPHGPVQVDMALDYGGDASLAIVLT